MIRSQVCRHDNRGIRAATGRAAEPEASLLAVGRELSTEVSRHRPNEPANGAAVDTKAVAIGLEIAG
jgi:hypothetical protein